MQVIYNKCHATNLCVRGDTFAQRMLNCHFISMRNANKTWETEQPKNGEELSRCNRRVLWYWTSGTVDVTEGRPGIWSRVLNRLNMDGTKSLLCSEPKCKCKNPHIYIHIYMIHNHIYFNAVVYVCTACMCACAQVHNATVLLTFNLFSINNKWN